jgi:hypothetical protein
MNNQNPPPGWYQDPDGFQCERFWDGGNWTLQTRPMVNPTVINNDNNNQSITPGWRFALVITGLICLIGLLYLASDPSYL